MKKIFLLPVAVLAFGFTYFQKATITPIAIGTTMPSADVKLYDVLSGKDVSLSDKKGEKGTLVIFSCNTCPFVIANQSRINAIQADAAKMNIGVVIINSNEAQRSDEDSKDAMKSYGEKNKFTAPYVVDVNSVLADAFGATRTPETYLFDKDNKLVYHGAIDDSPKDETMVKTKYLADAMTALSTGKEIATKNTVSSGCGIHRK
jgi:thiol-disulfide isomerase/thioredoxin